MSLSIGLTGGIASGKTLVAQEFMRLGVPVLDADQVAREVVSKGTPGLAEIVEHFGPQLLQPDGELDRRAMRALVFGQPEQLKKLESLTHPRIREQIRRWCAAQGGPYYVVAVPLLAEGGNVYGFDRVLVVDVPVEVQLQRLMQRDGSDQQLAQKIIASQASRSQRLSIADDVLLNDGTPAQAQARVLDLHNKYLNLNAPPG